MFELLELIEFLPEILEIGSAARKYRENEADARLRFETFAYGTLAQHRARLASQKPQSETGRSEEPS
jgi:hypothetical protein